MIAKPRTDDGFPEVFEQVVRHMDSRYCTCSTSCREYLDWKFDTIVTAGLLAEKDSPAGYLRRALENAARNYFRPFVKWGKREVTTANFEETYERQLIVNEVLDLKTDFESFWADLPQVERYACATLCGDLSVRDAAKNASVSVPAIYKARERVRAKGQHIFRSYEHDRN